MRSLMPKRRSVGDQRCDAIEEEIVKLGSGLASDLDGIFESGGGDERGAGAIALEERVGSNGGAVQEDDRFFGSDFPEGIGDSLRGVGRRGENLQHAKAAGFHPDTVGESAAGIDGDAKRLRGAAGHGTQKSNTGGSAGAGCARGTFP